MLRRIFPKKARSRTVGLSFVSLLVPACLLLVSPILHSEDAYLDALRLEEERLNDKESADRDEVKSESVASSDDQRAKFENELEASYRGTFLFYKKLPAKSQEEVFRERQQGASIDEVRKTIMNRYLHSH
jgi:hypothetical protein